MELCCTLRSGAKASGTTRGTGHIYLVATAKQSRGCEVREAAAGWLSWASARQPSFPRQPPCLPSWGLTQEMLQPAPRPQNSSDAFQRPPFVLHSSNQLPRAHLLSTGAQTPATSHLYANYFATWTKVIMLSDRKLTGPKSRMEINKLTPLNDREDGHACWRQRSLH